MASLCSTSLIVLPGLATAQLRARGKPLHSTFQGRQTQRQTAGTSLTRAVEVKGDRDSAGRRRVSVQSMADVQTGGAGKVEERLGIRIERDPSEARLSELGVRSWSKWGCPPSKFPWTYSSKETCYLLKGRVKVTPSGTDEFVEFGAKDLVVFPSGMSCTWDVAETVDKHFLFE